MSVAEGYFLVAHDEHSGRPVVGVGKLGYGLAASMLADLALGGHISVDAAEVTTTRRGAVPEDALEHQTLDLIRTEPTHSVRMWLDYLAQDARGQVGQRLVRAGIARRGETRRWMRRMVVYRPLDVDRAARRIARLVSQLRVPAQMPPGDVALVKILAVTELLEHALWWEPELRRAALPAVDAMLPDPVRELAYHTQTAVGTTALEG